MIQQDIERLLFPYRAGDRVEVVRRCFPFLPGQPGARGIVTGFWRVRAWGRVLEVTWEDGTSALLGLDSGDEVRPLPPPAGPLRVSYFGLFQLEATKPHNIFRRDRDEERGYFGYQLLRPEGWIEHGDLSRFELKGEFGAGPITVAEAHRFLAAEGYALDEVDRAAAEADPR